MRSSADLDGALDAIRAWGEDCDWAGWDPYDALNSPLARVLSGGRPLGRRLLTQVVKTSPVNVRPLLRIPRERDAKGVALAASGYARLAAARGDEAAAATARELVDWLLGAATPGRVGIGWGYHFDVQTRFFRYERGQPNAIATAFAAHALLDARELIGLTVGDDALRAAADFFEHDLLAVGPRPFFRYVGLEPVLVHNANLLACSVLARAALALDDPALAEAVAAPLRTTLDAQAPNGSWPYTDDPAGAWVDNFHTGYVLESLAACVDLAPGIVPRLRTGIRFWERALFKPDGTPCPTMATTFPVDSHSYAQAIETWLAVRPWRVDALDRAERAARLLVAQMLAPDGHVYFERRRLWTNRVAFVRWTTAAAFRALARLALVCSRAPSSEAEVARLG